MCKKLGLSGWAKVSEPTVRVPAGHHAHAASGAAWELDQSQGTVCAPGLPPSLHALMGHSPASLGSWVRGCSRLPQPSRGEGVQEPLLSDLQETAVSPNDFQLRKRLAGCLWRPLSSQGPQPEGWLLRGSPPPPKGQSWSAPPLRPIQANSVLGFSICPLHASLGRTWRRLERPASIVPTLAYPGNASPQSARTSGGPTGDARLGLCPGEATDTNQRPASRLMKCGPQVAGVRPTQM